MHFQTPSLDQNTISWSKALSNTIFWSKALPTPFLDQNTISWSKALPNTISWSEHHLLIKITSKHHLLIRTPSLDQMHFQTTSARLDQMQDHLQDLIRCTRRHHLQDLIRCNTICKTWSDALADTICKTWSDARPSAFTWSDALADTMCKTSCTPTRTLPRQAIWSDKCYNILINATKVRFWFKTSRSKQSSCCVHVPLNPKQYSLNSVSTADYSLLTTTTVCSQRLQFAHNDYSLLTTITVCSQRLQFAHNDYSLLTTTTVCSQRLQFAHNNYSLRDAYETQTFTDCSHSSIWPESYIYGVYTVFLAGESPNIRCIYTVLANPTHSHTSLYLSLDIVQHQGLRMSNPSFHWLTTG